MRNIHPRSNRTAGRPGMVLLLLALLPWLGFTATASGPAVLLQAFSAGPGMRPSALTAHQGLLFFGAGDKRGGTALWKSDGTPAGTTPIKTLHDLQSWIIPEMVVANNLVFFVSSDDGGNRELWISNGTPAGTTLLTSGASGLTVVDGTVFFFQLDPVLGPALWKTDGTAVGTQLVRYLDPSFDPNRFGCGGEYTVSMDGQLFFLADDGDGGRGLWRSDGTSSGTILLSSVACDTLFPGSPVLIAVQHKLFFVGSDAAHGQELWTSDGTASGTGLVKDIVPGPDSSYLRDLTALNGTLMFVATTPLIGAELWRSDGTTSGTFLVKDIFPGYAGPCSRGCPPSFGPANLTTMNGALFFGASDYADSVQRNQLWRSDGTPDGTAKVKDIILAVAGELTDTCGTLLFSAYTSAAGTEPWISDGTPGGTMMLQDLAVGPADSYPMSFTRAGKHVFFVTQPGTSGSSQIWALPWPIPRPAAQTQAVGEVQAYLPVILAQQTTVPC
jgi:ELWxxDGT repeat protein